MAISPKDYSRIANIVKNLQKTDHFQRYFKQIPKSDQLILSKFTRQYASRDIGLGIGSRSRATFELPKLAGFKGRNVELTIEQQILDQLGQHIDQVKDNFVDELLRTIQDKTPVKTGKARAGWIRIGDMIINPVEYVKYLEFGTDKMKPYAMVGSTLAMSQRILDLAISNTIK